MAEVLFWAPNIGNVYLGCLPVEHPMISANSVLSTSGERWHRRFGHCGARALVVLKKNNSLHVSS